MSHINYLSVGIDVGSTFSFMSIVDHQEKLVLKPFKIFHNSLDSLQRARSEIEKAEELYSMKSRTFLESTGIYHFPLFCYLMESGFEVFVINPLITHSIKNFGIRKVKNDKLDSIGIAKLGLRPDLKTSVMPVKLVLEIRSLTRKYYELTDTRSGYVNRLRADLHTVFPQFLPLFSDITGVTSMMILKTYPTPDNILRGHRKTMIKKISKASRKGEARATAIYEKLIDAASAAKVFGYDIDSVYFNISINLKMIEEVNRMIASLIERIHSLVDEHCSKKFVKQIGFLESITGVGFLSAVTIMCEIGDFSSFKNPKQLFAYFGLDPSVSQSGKFQATEVHMSKRGSRIARRALFAVALASIRTNRNGEALNPVLLAYYKKKTESKAKKVALGAVMHKICNIIFAVLRDDKPYELRTSKEHCMNYRSNQLLAA
ncbi:MAG: IS110 family transposase [Pseudomonadota bacterium]|nr:IS110 family transposase [Pseudomonadota bacterium]